MIYRLLGTALLVLVFAACMGPPTRYVPAEAGPVSPPSPVLVPHGGHRGLLAFAHGDPTRHVGELSLHRADPPADHQQDDAP